MQMAQEILSINPATGKTIAHYQPFDENKVQGILKKAEKSFKTWRTTSLRDRANVLKSIAAQLRKDRERLAKLATIEMGKPIEQSRKEVEKCAYNLEYYAKHGASFLKNELVETEARKSYVSYQPLGVVLAIMPWNFPYWQVFRAMGPILMGGNTMVLKHASNVTGCALAIEKIIKTAGAPAGLLQTIVAPSSAMSAVIAAPEIAAVTFTGSTEAGKKIASVAGGHLKKQVLELGGSDPYIILDDADLEKAVDILVAGRLVNNGQSCVAAKRFIVVPPVYKEFLTRFTRQMEAASFGDPMDPQHKIGPLARTDLRTQLHEQVEKSIAMGAQLLCGGYIPEGEGAYYPPTVLANVVPGMPAYDEELFGPVASIIKAKNEKDAIRIANDTVYGLGAGIFSKNRKKAEAIAAFELEAGSCFVNEFVHSDPRLPFGGIKQSGYGRELGLFGIREFVNIKTIFIQ